jgi:hypothetical protein
MHISERDEFLKKNPDIEQTVVAVPTVGGVGFFGGKRPDDAFRDKLRMIKKANPRCNMDIK